MEMLGPVYGIISIRLFSSLSWTFLKPRSAIEPFPTGNENSIRRNRDKDKRFQNLKWRPEKPGSFLLLARVCACSISPSAFFVLSAKLRIVTISRCKRSGLMVLLLGIKRKHFLSKIFSLHIQTPVSAERYNVTKYCKINTIKFLPGPPASSGSVCVCR